jgi:hypothetical protein
MSDAVFLKEMWIPRGDDGVTGEKPSMTVIGMKSVTLPRIVTKNDLRLETTYMARNFSPKFASVVEISVNLVHENNFANGA